MVILTEEDANHLLSILEELPIKYLPILLQVRQFLESKLQKTSHGGV